MRTSPRVLLALVLALLILPVASLPAQDGADGEPVSIDAAKAVERFEAACWQEAKLQREAARQAFRNLYDDLQSCKEAADFANGKTHRIVAEAALGKFIRLCQDVGRFPREGDGFNGNTAFLAMKDALVGQRIREARANTAVPAELDQKLGFLTNWTFIGPFRNESGVGLDTAYPPESEHPPALGVEVAGSARPVSWRQMPMRLRLGRVSFDDLLRPNTKAVAYAVVLLQNAGDAARPVALRFGTSGAHKVWVNGGQVHTRDAARTMTFDQDVAGARLQPGINRLMIKLCCIEQAWQFAMRLTQPDGSPLPEGAVTEVGFDDAEAFGTAWQASLEQAAASESVVVHVGPSQWLFGDDELPGMTTAQRHFLRAIFHELNHYDDPKRRKAAEAMEAALAVDPDNGLYHWEYSEVAGEVAAVQHEREENERRDHLQQAVEHAPDLAGAWADLARYYLELRRIDDAEAALEKAMAAAPDAPELLTTRLELLEARRYTIEAETLRNALWESFTAGDKLDATQLRVLARHATGNGRDAEAIQILQARLAQDAQDSYARDLLVARYTTRGEHDKAEALLQQVLALYPTNPGVRDDLADLYKARQRFDEVVTLCEEVVQLCPHEVDGWMRLGRELYLADEVDRAHVAWRRALELDPTNGWLKEYFAFIEEGDEKAWEDRFVQDITGIIADVRANKEMKDDFTHDVVYRQEVVRVERDGKARYYDHEAIRITNDDGTRRFRQYNPGGQGDSRVLMAKIHRVDGTVEDARISRWGAVDFGTDLKIGDVLEWRVRTFTAASGVFGDYFGRRFYFQDEVPMHHYRLALAWPGGKRIGMHPPEIVSLAVKSNDTDEDVDIYEWSRDDCPELEREVGMPPAHELVPTLEVSTYRTWDEFAIWYWNLIRKQVLVTDDIRAAVVSLIDGTDDGDTGEQIRRIYEFVANDLRYNDAWEFGIHGYQPFTAQAILRRRFGDCKDKAILLCAMLSCIGVKAHPVIIRSAWMRGDEDVTLPLIQHFNHAIAMVEMPDGTEHFVDGTANLHPIDTYPSADAGARVLVVYPDKGRIVQVPWPKPEENANRDRVTVTIAADGSATIVETRKPTRQAGAMMRYRYQNPDPERRKEMEEQRWGGELAGADVASVESTDIKDLTTPVEMVTKLSVPTFARRDGDALLVKPITFARDWTRTPYASLDRRQYDLLTGPPMGEFRERTFIAPEGYALAEVPEDVEFETDFCFYRMQTEATDTGFVVRTSFYFKNHRIRAAEYAEWRKVAAAMDQAEARTLRLEPKD